MDSNYKDLIGGSPSQKIEERLRNDPEADNPSIIDIVGKIALSIVAIKASSWGLKKAGMHLFEQGASRLPSILEGPTKNLAEDVGSIGKRMDKYAAKLSDPTHPLADTTKQQIKSRLATRGNRWAKNALWEMPAVIGVNEMLYKPPDKRGLDVGGAAQLIGMDLLASVVAPAAGLPYWRSFAKTPQAEMLRENLSKYGQQTISAMHAQLLQGSRVGSQLTTAMSSMLNDLPTQEEMTLGRASKRFKDNFLDGWHTGKDKFNSRIENLTDIKLVQRFRGAREQADASFNNYLRGKYQKQYIEAIKSSSQRHGLGHMGDEEANSIYEASIRGASADKHQPQQISNLLRDDIPKTSRRPFDPEDLRGDYFKRFGHDQESFQTTSALLKKNSRTLRNIDDKQVESFLDSVTREADAKYVAQMKPIIRTSANVSRYTKVTKNDLDMAESVIARPARAQMSQGIQESIDDVGEFNIFGFRRASVKEYTRHVYSTGKENAIKKVLAERADLHKAGIRVRGKVADPYIFITKDKGKVLDFSFLRGSGTKMMTGIQQNTQIPMLGFNPLQLFQYSARQKSKREGFISWISPGERQPGLSKNMLSDPHLKIGKKIYKWSDTGMTKLPGEYNTFTTDAQSAFGRTIQNIHGMHSELREPGAPGPIKRRIQKKFPSLFKALAVDEHSSGSVPTIIRKWATGTPMWSAANFAEKHGKTGLAASLRAKVPDSYFPKIVDTLKKAGTFTEGEDLSEMERNLYRMVDWFHPGVPSRVVNEIKQGRLKPSSLFRGDNATFISKASSETDAAETIGIDKILASLRKGNNEDLANVVATLERDAINRRPTAGDSLTNVFYEKLNKHLKVFKKSVVGYADEPVSKSSFAMKETVQRERIEKDIIAYLFSRSTLLSGADDVSFNIGIKQLDDFVQEIATSGTYGKRIARETRAAMASAKMTAYKGKYKDIPSRFSRMRSDDKLIGDLDAITESWLKSPTLKGWRSSTEDVRFQSKNVNYYGSDVTYLPTFGSALKNNSSAAYGGLLGDRGIKTAGSVFAHHMVSRLSSPLEMIGLGFAPNRFKSAGSLLLNGFILRRFLPAMMGIEAFRYLDWQAKEKTGRGLSEEAIRLGVVEPTIMGAKVGEALGVQKAADWFGKVTGEEDRMNILKYATKTGDEMEQFWQEGETPVRRGRWWMLGNQPFEGSRTQFYQPNIYQRSKSRYKYTYEGGMGPEEEYFSHSWLPSPSYPLAPLHKLTDPYWFEKGSYDTRPYPLTGDLLTGPYGPAGPLLNATIGQLIKPQLKMHPEAWIAIESGRYPGTGEPVEGLTVPYAKSVGGAQAQQLIAADNERNKTLGFIASQTVSAPFGINKEVIHALYQNVGISSSALSYSIPNPSTARFGSNIGQPGIVQIPASPLSATSETLYKTQEMMGIYGFGIQSIREKLGMSPEYAPPVTIAEASKAYGFGQRFWGANLGGMGDFVAPGLGGLSNIMFSEIFRRFVPREPGNESINPTPNQVWNKYPWLPGPYSNYFKDFSKGDPYSEPGAGMNMPGASYERLHGARPNGYSWEDQLRILSNVAPWSPEYKSVAKGAATRTKTSEQQQFYDTMNAQHEDISNKYQFSEYRFRGDMELKKNEYTVKAITPQGYISVNEIPEPIKLAGLKSGGHLYQYLNEKISPGQKISITTDLQRERYTLDQKERVVEALVGSTNKDLIKGGYEQEEGGSPLSYYARTNFLERGIGSAWEGLTHKWNPLTTKFINRRSALEQYERTQVYGRDFAPWSEPYASFVRPIGESMETKGFIGSAIAGGGIGLMAGRGKGKVLLGVLGAVAGLATKGAISAEEALTGNRWVPEHVKGRWDIEEYTDILTYIQKSRTYNSLRQRAIQSGEEDPEAFWNKYTSAKSTGRMRDTTGQISDMNSYAVPSVDKYAINNPIAAQAIASRKEMGETLYGADVSGDLLSIYKAFPKSRRPYLESFLNAKKKDRKKILDVLPLLERRALEAQWGQNVEARPALDTYFQNRHLPSPNSAFWSPNTDMDQMKIKIIERAGEKVSDYGYYPQEAQQAAAYPIPAPNFNGPNTRHIGDQLQEILSGMGMYGTSISVTPSSTPGLNMTANIQRDMSDRIREYIGA